MFFGYFNVYVVKKSKIARKSESAWANENGERNNWSVVKASIADSGFYKECSEICAQFWFLTLLFPRGRTDPYYSKRWNYYFHDIRKTSLLIDTIDSTFHK